MDLYEGKQKDFSARGLGGFVILKNMGLVDIPSHGRTTSNPFGGGTKFLPEKFVTAMTSPKKKKGHRLFRCTFPITFGLNMPSNVSPNRC